MLLNYQMTLRKMLNFVKSKNFTIYKNFEDFFVKDILNNSKIIRFHEQLLKYYLNML